MKYDVKNATIFTGGTSMEEKMKEALKAVSKAMNGVVLSSVKPVQVGNYFVRALFGLEHDQAGVPLLTVQASTVADFGPHGTAIVADNGDQYQIRCRCGYRSEWSRNVPERTCPMRPTLCEAIKQVAASFADYTKEASRGLPRVHSLSVTTDRVVCLCGWTGRETSSAFKIADRLQRGCPEDRDSSENKADRARAQVRAERKRVVERDERAQVANRVAQERAYNERQISMEQRVADAEAKAKRWEAEYNDAVRLLEKTRAERDRLARQWNETNRQLNEANEQLRQEKRENRSLAAGLDTMRRDRDALQGRRLALEALNHDLEKRLAAENEATGVLKIKLSGYVALKAWRDRVVFSLLGWVRHVNLSEQETNDEAFNQLSVLRQRASRAPFHRSDLF